MGDLFGSNILEMALGLIFIYFLLSIICSSINEFFAGLLKWRARDLERGIVNLIRDPGKARELLNNPLVVAMGSRNTEPVLVKLCAGDRQADQGKVYLKNTASEGQSEGPNKNTSGGEKKGKKEKEPLTKNYAGKPSYIPSRTFVLALLDTVVEGPVNVQSIRATATRLIAQEDRDPNSPIDPNLVALGKTLLLLLDDSKPGGRFVIKLENLRHIVQALPDSAERTQILGWIDSASSIDEVRDKVLEMDALSAVRKSVVAFIGSGFSELEAYKLRLESWYDNAVDHISGVYKRRIQIYLFGFGLLVALLVGADSLHIASTLSSNSAVRQALVADVRKAVTPGGEFYFNPTVGASSLETNTISVITSTVALTSTEGVTTTTTTVSLPNTQTVVDELKRFGQLFGYDAFWEAVNKGDLGRQIVLGLGKALGLLITAFAVSFGAPFWFDLLNKVANLRSGAKPAEKSTATT